MAHSVAPMDDRQIVAAMRSRSANGLAAAYDLYAERLHAYARSILSDHDAAADVVHDAFLLAGQRIGELRDPDRLRPWLYAIVRHECLRQLRTSSRHVELTEAGQVRDDSVDLDAGLRTEQYRELIWTAAAGLNLRDREVLELSVRHGLDGADLAAALGVSTNHAHALASRARQQLERALTVVIVARTGRRDCAALDALLTNWDGQLTALWRKRIARHIEHCEACGGTKRREVRATALLATVPFVALPIALRDRVLSAAANPQLVAYQTDLATRSGQFDHGGFPRSATNARRVGLAAPRRIALPSAAAVLVVGALLLFLLGPVENLWKVSSDSPPATAASQISAGIQQTPMTPATDIQSPPLTINQPTEPVRPPDGSGNQSSIIPHPTVTVPNLLGLNPKRAQQKLQAVGLIVGSISLRTGVPPTQAGIVLLQIPSAGTSVAKDSPVTLTVGGELNPCPAAGHCVDRPCDHDQYWDHEQCRPVSNSCGHDQYWDHGQCKPEPTTQCDHNQVTYGHEGCKPDSSKKGSGANGSCPNGMARVSPETDTSSGCAPAGSELQQPQKQEEPHQQQHKQEHPYKQGHKQESKQGPKHETKLKKDGSENASSGQSDSGKSNHKKKCDPALETCSHAQR